MQFRNPAAIMLLLSSSFGYGGSLDSYSLVKLNYGVNRVDFNNDGSDDLIILANRENFNAHGFGVVSFYSEQPQDQDKQKKLGAVSIFEKDKEKFSLNVSGGAGCLLNDFRLLKPKSGNQALLIIASRKFSESFIEENVVTFSYYRLENNSTGEIGRPFAYFNLSEIHQSKSKYCDVTKAFQSELGLDNYREIN